MKHKNSINVLAQNNISNHPNTLAVAQGNHDWNFTVCKKIAQLTKVVYTLNCRVEDSDERIHFMANVHAVQMQQLKQNNVHKVNELVQQVVQYKQHSQRAIKLMQQQHRKLLQQVKTQHDTQIRQMLLEVKQNKSVFETKLKQNVQKTLRENKQTLNNLSASKDAEIQKLVLQYNDKYKSMLAQQLDAKDALEQKLNLQWAQKLKWVQTQLGNKCNELSRQLSQRTQALRVAQKQQKQLAQTQQSLIRKNQQLDTCICALKEAVHQKELTLTSCQQNLHVAITERNAQKEQLQMLQHEMDYRLAQVEAYKHDLLQKERYTQKLISDLTVNGNTITSLTTQKNAMALDNAKYLLQIEQLQKSILLLQQQLNATSNTAAGNKTAIQVLQNALQAAKVKQQKLQQIICKSEAQHASAMQSLQQTMQKQAAQYKQLTKQADIAAAQQQRKRMTQLVQKHELQIKQHKLANSTLHFQLEKWKTQLQNKQSVIQQLNHDMQQLQRKNDKICQALCKAQKQIKQAQDAHLRQRVQIQQKLDEANRRSKEWQQTVNVNKQMSGARNAEKIEELRRTFAAQKQQLMQQHKRIRESVQKTQHNQLQIMQQQMQKLSANHRSQLSKLKTQHEQMLRQRMSDHQLSQQIINTKHSQQIQSMHKLFARRFDEAEVVWSSLRKQLQHEKQELQSKLHKAQKHAHDRQTENLQSTEAWHSKFEQMSKQLQEMNQFHKKQLDKIKSQAQTAFQDSLQRQQKAHSIDIAQLRNAMQNTQQRNKQQQQILMKQCNKQLASQKANHEKAMHQKVQSMMNENAQQLTELTNMYTSQINSLQRTSESALQLKHAQLQNANNEIAILTNNLTEKSSELQRTRQQLQRVQQLRAQNAQNFTQMMSNATTSHEKTIASLKTEHEMQIRKVGEIHQRIVDDLNVQMQQTQLIHASHEAELRSALKLLQHKYDYRQSRSEDVQLINTLRVQVKQVQKALEKAYEDMKLYKLQLINREQNYNKLFSRTPLVAARTPTLQQIMPQLFAKNKNNTTAAPVMIPMYNKSNSLPTLHKSTGQNSPSITK